MKQWALARVCFILVVTVAGCGPGESVRPLTGEVTEPPAFSVIYVIHGDGNYLYHATDGTEQYADATALAQADSVGRAATGAEVFIFHQKPARHFLLFFPRDDGELTVYHGGREIVRRTYRWSRPGERFAPEAELYHAYSMLPVNGGAPVPHRLLLYYGHQIPEGEEALYDVSHEEGTLSLPEFVAGVKRFAEPRGAEKPFDIVLLSTCNNGTPGVVHALSPLTRFVIGSPDDLHLSHMDTRGLGALKKGASFDPGALADTLAHQSFARLTRTTHTVVTVAVYDVERTAPYVNAVMPQWLERQRAQSLPIAEQVNIDCATDPRFENAAINEGVTLYYRPPMFGRGKGQTRHSGWGCPESTSANNSGAQAAPGEKP